MKTHYIDNTRTYPAAKCGAAGGRLTRRATRLFVTCERCRAKLGLTQSETPAAKQIDRDTK